MPDVFNLTFWQCCGCVNYDKKKICPIKSLLFAYTILVCTIYVEYSYVTLCSYADGWTP